MVVKNVLFLGSYGSDNVDFRNTITSLTSGGRTDYFDAKSSTPKVRKLRNYDCVTVHTHGDGSYDDAATLGDNLASYVDDGGVVVLGMHSTQDDTGLKGRILNRKYSPVGATSRFDWKWDVLDYEGDGSTPLYSEISTFAPVSPWDGSVTLQGEGMGDGTFEGGYVTAAYRPDFRVVYLNGAMCAGEVFPSREYCPGLDHVRRWVNACSAAAAAASSSGSTGGDDRRDDGPMDQTEGPAADPAAPGPETTTTREPPSPRTTLPVLTAEADPTEGGQQLTEEEAAAKTKILFLSSYGADNPAFRRKISRVVGGEGARTDYYDAKADARAGLLSVDRLMGYDCVMVHPYDSQFRNADTLGDRLASYVDRGGGTVVLGMHSTDERRGLGGRIVTSGYSPVGPTSDSDWKSDRAEYAGDGTTALHDGISSYTSAWRRDGGVALQGDGMGDGTYVDGTMAAAYRPDFKVVYLNGALCAGEAFPSYEYCDGGAHPKRWVDACLAASGSSSTGGGSGGRDPTLPSDNAVDDGTGGMESGDDAPFSESSQQGLTSSSSRPRRPSLAGIVCVAALLFGHGPSSFLFRTW